MYLTTPYLIFIFFSLFFSNKLIGQDCSTLLTKQVSGKEIYNLQTEPVMLVIRGNSEYSIQFFYAKNKTEKAFTAQFTGSGIAYEEVLSLAMEQGDFLVFTALNGDKRSFEYTSNAKRSMYKNRKAFINTLKLEESSIEWLANNPLLEIRLVDTQKNKIYPLGINAQKDAAFGKQLKCFYRDLLTNEQLDTTSRSTANNSRHNKKLKEIEEKSCEQFFESEENISTKNNFKTIALDLINKQKNNGANQYNYAVFFSQNNDQIKLNLVHRSNNISSFRPLNKDMAITFTNGLDERKSFIFHKEGKTEETTSQNYIELDEKKLYWLGETAIQKIEFSYTSAQANFKIHSYKIEKKEQQQFSKIVSCCYQKKTSKEIIQKNVWVQVQQKNVDASTATQDSSDKPKVAISCSGILDSNHIINRIHRLSTLSTMGKLEGVDDISRAYILKFVNNESGLFLKVKRQGGNEGDVKQPLVTGFDVVFIARDQSKHKVRLVGQNTFNKDANFYSNHANLTLKDITWLYQHQITELRLSDPEKEEEYPTTLNEKSRIRIGMLSHCFYEEYMASPILNPTTKAFEKAVDCAISLVISPSSNFSANTKPLMLTGKQGNSYQYTLTFGLKNNKIHFFVDQKKGVAKPTSAPRVADKLMLVNKLGDRRVFTFIDQGKPMIQTPQGPVPNFSNEIYIGLKDMEWISEEGIQQIRLVTKKYPNNEPFQMAFTLNDLDQDKLYQNSNCFHDYLNRGKDKKKYAKTAALEEWESTLESAKNSKEEVNYKQALEQVLQAVQQAKNKYGKESKQYAKTLFETGKLQEELLQDIEAEAYFAKSLRIAQKSYGEQHSFVAEIHQKIADFYEQQKQKEEAESHYLNYLEIIEKNFDFDSDEYNNALAAVSSYYTRQKDFAKAIALAKKAKKRYKKIKKAKAKKGYLDVVVNAARVSAVTDSLSSAEIFYEEAEELASQHLLEKESKRSQITMELIDVYIADEKYEKAEKRLEKLKDEKALNSLQKTIVKDQMASIQIQQGQYQAATNIFVELTHDLIQQLYEFYPVLDDHERGILLDRTHNHLSKVYSSLDRNPEQFSAVTDKIEGLNLAVKNLVLENHIDFRQKILKSNDPQISNLYKNWSSTKKEIGIAYLLSPSELEREGISMDSLRNIAIQYEKQLHRLLQQEEKIYFPPILDTIKNILESHEAIVDFIHFTYHDGKKWTDSTRYAALVVNPNLEKTEYIPLAGAKDIKNILDFEIDPTSVNYITDLTENENLYQLIWKPINKFLQKSTTIHVATSGLLNKIALGALIVDSLENGFLLQQYNIHYYSSFRDWTKATGCYSDRLNTKEALLVGGVKFDMDSTEMVKQSTLFKTENGQNMGSIPQDIPIDNNVRFSPLPGTEKEVRQISRLLKQKQWNTEVLIGTRALEEKLKFRTGKNAPKILHLATHGYFYPEAKEYRKHRYFNDNYYSHRIIYAQNPLLRSGVMLAGVNCYWNKSGALPKGVDDGILTAYEVVGMDLYNTDLVILSACESGKGTINDMEGVLGLQRAFRLAGSQHVIVSLWKVPDEATAELMELFYQYYLNDYSVYTAFRKAQKDMSTRYENPYYWASFLLIEGRKSEVSELEEFYMQKREIENALALIKELERQRKYTEALQKLEETAKKYTESPLLVGKMEKPVELDVLFYLLNKVNNLAYLKKAIIYYKDRNRCLESLQLLKKAIKRNYTNSCELQNELANLLVKQLYVPKQNWRKNYQDFALKQEIYKDQDFSCLRKQFKQAWKKAVVQK